MLCEMVCSEQSLHQRKTLEYLWMSRSLVLILTHTKVNPKIPQIFVSAVLF